MRQLKAFATTFIISFSVMLCGFMAMYWISVYDAPQATGENKTGVPVLTPDYNDSKTTLVILDADSADFFFLIKLNALQNKVNVVSLPSSLHLSSAGRTLGESMAYAGAMQCVQDISENFDISVDYHLVCGLDSIEKITAGFAPFDVSSVDGIPQSVSSYILNGRNTTGIAALSAAVYSHASVLDNLVGITFLNMAAEKLIRDNMESIYATSIDSIKENFSRLSTNMNTEDLDRLKRIMAFLLADNVQFDRIVLSDAATAQQDINRILKE